MAFGYSSGDFIMPEGSGGYYNPDVQSAYFAYRAGEIGNPAYETARQPGDIAAAPVLKPSQDMQRTKPPPTGGKSDPGMQALAKAKEAKNAGVFLPSPYHGPVMLPPGAPIQNRAAPEMQQMLMQQMGITPDMLQVWGRSNMVRRGAQSTTPQQTGPRGRMGRL